MLSTSSNGSLICTLANLHVLYATFATVQVPHFRYSFAHCRMSTRPARPIKMGWQNPNLKSGTGTQLSHRGGETYGWAYGLYNNKSITGCLHKLTQSLDSQLKTPMQYFGLSKFGYLSHNISPKTLLHRLKVLQIIVINLEGYEETLS